MEEEMVLKVEVDVKVAAGVLDVHLGVRTRPTAMARRIEVVVVVGKGSRKGNHGRGGRAHSRQHTMRATANPAPITTRAENT
ncbi:hypothetical protein E2C01_072069 [Portunus trituberculatus]|uniref:Uncharacterized protein n=1 Tax=Portunus trituberculatus TaxID=210409 RepID=A0A5B7HX15_PORTR|nr:hypothetical protein [Portunus trituberculatus]